MLIGSPGLQIFSRFERPSAERRSQPDIPKRSGGGREIDPHRLLFKTVMRNRKQGGAITCAGRALVRYPRAMRTRNTQYWLDWELCCTDFSPTPTNPSPPSLKFQRRSVRRRHCSKNPKSNLFPVLCLFLSRKYFQTGKLQEDYYTEVSVWL